MAIKKNDAKKIGSKKKESINNEAVIKAKSSPEKKNTTSLVVKKNNVASTTKKEKKSNLPENQKHTIVPVEYFEKEYDFETRKKDWHKKAGHNESQLVCSRCKDDDNWETILLDNGKHICYYCWIKKPDSLKKHDKDDDHKKVKEVEVVETKTRSIQPRVTNASFKKEKKSSLPENQKHTIVPVEYFEKEYDFETRKKDWHKKAGHNDSQLVCSKCKDDDNWETILLDNGKHICYYCWIKKPDSLKNQDKEDDNRKDVKEVKVVETKEIIVQPKVNNEPSKDDKNNIKEKRSKSRSLLLRKKSSKKQDDETIEESKTKKVVIVKKTIKHNASNADSKDKAIEKYKNVPLGDLYKDLNEMKAYVDVLNQRRNELLAAKSHKNPNVKKEAIKRTMENTFAIKFKYQDANFRNHFVPSGLTYIEGQQFPQEGGTPAGPRSMQRSNEISVTGESSYYSPGITINYNNNGQPQSSYRQHAGMERRDGLTASQYGNSSVGIIQNTQVTDSRYINQQGMQNRPGLTPNGMPPPPGMQQMMPPPPGMQQMVPPPPGLQQQQVLDPTQRVQPIRVIDKPVVRDTKLDVWPLYVKIKELVENRKQPKILFAFLIIFCILLMLAVAFFILWGFAVDWSNWDMDIGEAFRNLFKPFA